MGDVCGKQQQAWAAQLGFMDALQTVRNWVTSGPLSPPPTRNTTPRTVGNKQRNWSSSQSPGFIAMTLQVLRGASCRLAATMGTTT